jgi:hypothetical protein
MKLLICSLKNIDKVFEMFFHRIDVCTLLYVEKEGERRGEEIDI